MKCAVRYGCAGGQAEKGGGVELLGACGVRQAGGGQPCSGTAAVMAHRSEGIGERFAALAEDVAHEMCNRLP